MTRPRVVVVGLGDTGVLTAIALRGHADVVGISPTPQFVSGQELGLRLARPRAWERDYRIDYSRVRRGLTGVRRRGLPRQWFPAHRITLRVGRRGHRLARLRRRWVASDGIGRGFAPVRLGRRIDSVRIDRCRVGVGRGLAAIRLRRGPAPGSGEGSLPSGSGEGSIPSGSIDVGSAAGSLAPAGSLAASLAPLGSAPASAAGSLPLLLPVAAIGGSIAAAPMITQVGAVTGQALPPLPAMPMPSVPVQVAPEVPLAPGPVEPNGRGGEPGSPDAAPPAGPAAPQVVTVVTGSLGDYQVALPEGVVLPPLPFIR